MKPNGGGEPTGALADAIKAKWGLSTNSRSLPDLRRGNFGSGWTWLVKKADGSVDIVQHGCRRHPADHCDKAPACVDVWEHAYYID